MNPKNQLTIGTNDRQSRDLQIVNTIMMEFSIGLSYSYPYAFLFFKTERSYAKMKQEEKSLKLQKAEKQVRIANANIPMVVKRIDHELELNS